MTYLKTVGGPGASGLHPQDVVITVKNGSGGALAAGAVVQFDFTTGTGIPGVEASGFYTVNTPLANAGVTGVNRRGAHLAVCQEPIAAGATGKVMVSGITNVSCASSAVKGGYLVNPGADNALDQAATASAGSGFKIHAVVLSIATTTGEPVGTLGANSATFPLVWFDGIYGFGQDAVNV